MALPSTTRRFKCDRFRVIPDLGRGGSDWKGNKTERHGGSEGRSPGRAVNRGAVHARS